MAYNSVQPEIKRSAQLNVEEEQRSIEAANQNSAIARIVNIIYFLFGLLIVLLGVRVVMHMLSANTGNGFADFIYGITQPFVALFAGLFANPSLGGTAVLELTTLAAIVVYAILAWVIGRVVWLALSRPR
jgi:YggT family protein